MREFHLAISVLTLFLVVVFMLQLNEVNERDEQLKNAVKAAIYQMEF